MSTATETIEQLANREYKYGFVTDVESETIPKGLSEEVVRLISRRRTSRSGLLEWRLKAYRLWLTMKEPTWQNVKYDPINYQDIIYYSAPKKKKVLNSLDEVDPEVRATFDKLGIPIHEQKIFAGVAVDAVFDSVSVATTFRDKLASMGIIFMSFSEAVHNHPELVKKYLGSVVPHTDNFFAALNSAGLQRRLVRLHPEGRPLPDGALDLLPHQRQGHGQFERTLIIADEGSFVSYLEGCTAPMRDENQLHAAVVELVAHDDATIKYSTIQNWYPGDKEGKGGIYNFVTKRGLGAGPPLEDHLDPGRDRLGDHLEVPRLHPQGDGSIGEFYSVATTNNWQQADTGTKMIHIGKNTRSTIVSKGISAGHGQNTYRGLVRIGKNASGARNYSQCDSLLIGDKCGAHTFPYLEIRNTTAKVEHEASTSKIGEDQIFYCRQRGITAGGRREHDRQRLLQGSLPRAADGIRGRSTEAAEREPGRIGRLTQHADIKNLQVKAEDKEILKGIDLHVNAGEVHAIMGPQRLRQEHAGPRAVRPPGIRRHGRPRSSSRARTSSRWIPTRAPGRASSWRSSTRSRSPASTTPTSSRRR
jgi:Fe-S cluster assembly protein SufB